MSSKPTDSPWLEALKEQFLLPVLRFEDKETLLQVGRALIEGGCKVMEITLMHSSNFEAIQELSKSCVVGAGTVLSLKQANAVEEAGAQFLVSPGLTKELFKKPPLPYIPGVATATEVQRALSHGFEILKLFPAKPLGGPEYLKALQSPFPQIHWMPTGGIEVEDFKAYRKLGCLAVGVGGKLFPKEEVQQRQWTKMSERFSEWRGSLKG